MQSRSYLCSAASPTKSRTARLRPLDIVHGAPSPRTRSLLIGMALAVGSVTSVCCEQPDQARRAFPHDRLFDADRALRHIRIISSDAYAGRAHATAGAAMTRTYIEAVLDTLGVAAPDGAFARSVFSRKRENERTGNRSIVATRTSAS